MTSARLQQASRKPCSCPCSTFATTLRLSLPSSSRSPSGSSRRRHLGKVRGAEDALNAQRVSELEGQLERQLEVAGEDASRLEALETYVERTYTPLMADRLAGDSTAVVLFGPVSETVRTAIEATPDSSVSARTVVLDIPLDPERLDDLLTSQEDLTGFAGGGDPARLGDRRSAVSSGRGRGGGALPRVAAELVAELEGARPPRQPGRSWPGAGSPRPISSPRNARRPRPSSTV